jgi:hypothetical protein
MGITSRKRDNRREHDMRIPGSGRFSTVYRHWYSAANKRPFYHSSTDHPRVTKGPAPCRHPEIWPQRAFAIQPFTFARTTCTATPRIRPTGILALLFGSLPLERGEGFDGVSQTGQPVAPDLPAVDSLQLRCSFPANGRESSQ